MAIKKSLFLSVLCGMLLLGQAYGVPVSSAKSGMGSPAKEVETVTRQLLSTFEKNFDRYKSDNITFIKEVDRQLSPVVDFESIAKGVMGRYRRLASPAQQAQFSDVFKKSLLDFYSKAILSLDDPNLSVDRVSVNERELEQYRQGAISQVGVDMKVKTSNRLVDLNYKMIHTGGRWKLRNVIVDGVNVGVTFRKLFQEAVDKVRDADIQPEGQKKMPVSQRDQAKVGYVINHWSETVQASDKNKQ